MNNAKKLRKETPSLKNNLCSGRIVELLELRKHLKCCWCERVLSLENITNKTRKGLYSILNVKCNECNIETIVLTDKVYATKSEVKHSDVNTKAVLVNKCFENAIISETMGKIKKIQTIFAHSWKAKLSGENYVTGSTILPISLELGKTLIDEYNETEIDDEIVVLKREMSVSILNILKSRYESDKNTHELLQTATFMDPRFKGSFFSDAENNVIKDIILQLSSELEIIPAPENRPASSRKKSGLSSIFKSIKNVESSNAVSLFVKIKKEIEQYINRPAIDVEEDSLVWWKYNAHVFPFLTQCAKKFLSIQASSVPSERVFSKGGQIVSDLRASLSGDHIEQLVFLTMNIRFVNIDKNT
ncbi:unnamed protein product [Psylliodes chrysocephalus]|uniref:HAT C-terminal dimerisation domain-containing protein n=1 Tax=Psylliodes chrysocephalus TaxID=3402493 RepID=A0A9P0CUB9_9CUCU|nr:unnamed protein product [Psylliodes chrysocephala]